SNRIFVALQPNWTQIFSGETITAKCEINGVGDTEWECEWRTTSSNTPPTHSEYRISSASVSHSGQYWCKGRWDSYSSTEWVYTPRPTVMADRRTLPVGGNKTLICSVEDSAEWKHYWFRRTSVFTESQNIRDGEPDRVISSSQEAFYHCRGGRGNPVFFTEYRSLYYPVTVVKRVGYTELLEYTEWEYEWSKPNSNTISTHNGYIISSTTVSNSRNYRCMGKPTRDLYSSTAWSNDITLTVSSKLKTQRQKANLSADNEALPAGGSVTLTHSLNLLSSSSPGWKYFCYRGDKTSEPLTTQDVVFLSTGQMCLIRRKKPCLLHRQSLPDTVELS
ncbi:hypothetical protein FQN60_006286, partial [Etheostoma spectabile]